MSTSVEMALLQYNCIWFLSSIKWRNVSHTPVWLYFISGSDLVGGGYVRWAVVLCNLAWFPLGRPPLPPLPPLPSLPSTSTPLSPMQEVICTQCQTWFDFLREPFHHHPTLAEWNNLNNVRFLQFLWAKGFCFLRLLWSICLDNCTKSWIFYSVLLQQNRNTKENLLAINTGETYSGWES